MTLIATIIMFAGGFQFGWVNGRGGRRARLASGGAAITAAYAAGLLIGFNA